MSYRSIDEIIDVLFDKSIYDEETGCWLWQGCVAGKGYGVIHFQGKQAYVHRVAYHIEHPDEALKVVRHSCDTPNCWSINHLHNGSTQDNVDDKVAKMRHIFGPYCHNAALDIDDIKKIRSSKLRQVELASKFKVSPATICYILGGKTWTHVQ